LVSDTGTYDAGIASGVHGLSTYDGDAYALVVLVVLQEGMLLLMVPALVSVGVHVAMHACGPRVLLLSIADAHLRRRASLLGAEHGSYSIHP